MNKGERIERLLEHDHCWHLTRKPMMMVVPDGHVHETCCQCPDTRLVHVDHAGGKS